LIPETAIVAFSAHAGDKVRFYDTMNANDQMPRQFFRQLLDLWDEKKTATEEK